jgi:predicted lipoprotein with Yx(FWY)xxD motif
MRLTNRQLAKLALAIGAAIVIVVGVVIAASGGGDDNGTATAKAGAGSEIVSVESLDGMKVLADARGRTLYSADVEKAGIRCTDGCTSFWDPVDASASRARSAADEFDIDLATVKRRGGERQLTLDGLPLYTFTQEGPGQLDGDGFVDDFNGTHFEWAAATTAAQPAPSGSDAPSDNSPY